MLKQKRSLIIATAFAVLLSLCLLNDWVFRSYLDSNYLQWYTSAGPLIALATAAFGAAWGGLDRNPALVSANPLAYCGACLQVAGLPFLAIGTHMRSDSRAKPIGIEAVPAMLLASGLAVAMLGWLVLIVPAQYFLFLISGSLSRLALASSAQLHANIDSGHVDISEHTPHGQGWWDASMRNKPVTLASAFGAALLSVIALFWS